MLILMIGLIIVLIKQACLLFNKCRTLKHHKLVIRKMCRMRLTRVQTSQNLILSPVMTMIFRYIPKRINKSKNDSQSLDNSNEFSAISSATNQERSSREKYGKLRTGMVLRYLLNRQNVWYVKL